jgi:hypothetical protein
VNDAQIVNQVILLVYCANLTLNATKPSRAQVAQVFAQDANTTLAGQQAAIQ